MSEEKSRKKDPKIVNESQKVFRILKGIFLIIAIVIVGISILAYSGKKKKEVTGGFEPEAAAQNWQLCWEKKPEHEGKTGKRLDCTPAVIKQKNDELVIEYELTGGGSGKIVCQQDSDHETYTGTWKDKWGSGSIHLRYTSPFSAFGWQDDGLGTEKIPTSVSVKS